MATWIERIRDTVKNLFRGVQTSLHQVGHLAALLPGRHEASGRIWIDSGGQVHVQNPHALHGLYPIIIVPPADSGITVEINGNLAEENEVVVEASDHIVIATIPEPPLSRFDIHIDDEGMIAVLTVEYRMGKTRTIESTEPATRLVIPVKTEWEAPDPITVEEVLEKLHRLGVHPDRVDHETLVDFVTRQESGSVRVAHGIPPVSGTSESYQPLPVETKIRYYQGIAVDRPGFVEIGEIIGILVPGEASHPGITVWGTPILPTAPPPNVFKLGDGVEMMERGMHLVATRSGRVRWEPGHVQVIPEKIFTGPVRTTLAYDGDLVIEGDVQGKVTAVASGHIIITGSVMDAEIVAKEQIWIFGETQGAVIYSGYQDVSYPEVLEQLRRLNEVLWILEHGYHQVCERMPDSHVVPGKIFAWLVQTKFPEWRSLVQWLEKMKTRSPYRKNPDLRLLVEDILPVIGREQLFHIEDVTLLERIHQGIEHFIDTVKHGEQGNFLSGVFLKVAIHTMIRSAGSVTLQEARLCDIESGDLVDITGQMIGGNVTAQESVTARTLGSEESIDTFVSVINPRGFVRSHLIHPQTVVQIGTYTEDFTTAMTDVVIDQG
ncbi:flagellar assembly protein A [Sulfobacillus thermosulfidooxidans]|uniref:flagellar assembly protein A n=1 Tax=Sulfobacillus thermosulfidooxidans TaxID=28034 RepID=UPI0006B504F1|nr:flagellar assembly protein A [Sulfobacillus thermosulfidooxidans]